MIRQCPQNLKKYDEFLLRSPIVEKQIDFKSDNAITPLENYTSRIRIHWGTFFPVKNGRIDFDKTQALLSEYDLS